MLLAIGLLSASALADEVDERNEVTKQAGATEPPDPLDVPEDAATPCPTKKVETVEGSWLDKTHYGIFRSACTAAQWFDGFFGDARYAKENSGVTWGYIRGIVSYDDYEGFDVRGRGRGRFALTNMSEKIDVVFGREDEDELIEDRNDGFRLPAAFLNSEEEWLLGLDWTPVARTESNLSFGVGLKVEFPLEPYVKGRYRYQVFVDNRNLIRFTESVFWRNQEGFGTTLGLDYDHVLSRRFLTRLSNRVSFTESTEGVEWRSDLTLYQALDRARAAGIAWSLIAEGETDREVPLKEYGFLATYRQNMLRDWFYGQVSAGFNFPKDDPSLDRELSWVIAVGFEFQFGDRDHKAPRENRRDPGAERLKPEKKGS